MNQHITIASLETVKFRPTEQPDPISAPASAHVREISSSSDRVRHARKSLSDFTPTSNSGQKKRLSGQTNAGRRGRTCARLRKEGDCVPPSSFLRPLQLRHSSFLSYRIIPPKRTREDEVRFLSFPSYREILASHFHQTWKIGKIK